MSIDNRLLLDRFVNGESFDELADDLGISKQSVSERVTRLAEIAENTPIGNDDSVELLNARADYMRRLTFRLRQQTESDYDKIDEIHMKREQVNTHDEYKGEGIVIMALGVLIAVIVVAVISI